MRALRVIEPDPVIDDPFCVEAVSDFMEIDGLLFQWPPQPFNEDVVKISAPTIH